MLQQLAEIDSSRCGMHENGPKIDLKYFPDSDIMIYMHFLEYINQYYYDNPWNSTFRL